MSAPVLTVLGGSTPFTAGFVEALRPMRSVLPACELRLFGRNTAALARMAGYARDRLSDRGWTASTHVSLEEAVSNAAVVVNQIRFGDLAARALDEETAHRFGVPADETLGPCGLLGALRVAPHLRRLGAKLGRHCPDAWILNLSNPLSVATAALLSGGAPRRTVGLCELPASTVRETCLVLGLPPDEVEWTYTGLNHRGFITSLRWKREDILSRLAELLGERKIFGIGAREIRQVGALPLKYFHLMNGGMPAPGRAAQLMAIKADLARELERDRAVPPSLLRRKLDWYDGAVVPLLEAIFSPVKRVRVVDRLAEDGLVREHRALVSSDGLVPLFDSPPPSVQPWLDAWVTHERAVLAAVETPGVERIRQALARDPTVPANKVEPLATHIATGGTHEE